MKEIVSVFLTLIFMGSAQIGISQTKEKIDKATAAGNTVFLVVTNGMVKFAETQQIANAAQKRVPKSVVVTLDKTIQANTPLISKYGLAGAPPPLILIIASNGVVAGGFLLNQVTADILVAAVPSKKQAEALLAFNQGKSAIIVLSKITMTDKAKAIDECKKSVTAMPNKAVLIDVDLNDKSEAAFIKMIGGSVLATKTNVMVFNSQGQFTSKFEAPFQSASIVASAKKVTQSGGGCCPGGSGSSGCGPKK